MPGAPLSSGPTRATRHFLTFRLGDRHYALPAEDLAEVIRIPTVARVPQSPPGLMGLANLRGAILPVASGRDLLGQSAAAAETGQARAMVLSGAAPVALAVDAVLELVELPLDKMETRAAKLAALPGELITGAFHAGAGHQVIKLLDIQSLLKTAFVVRARSAPASRSGSAAGDLLRTARAAENQVKMVAFAVADQEYALPLEAVEEIAAAPAILATVPHAEALVLGVASFRDGLLPLLSLRGLLGLARHSSQAVTEKVVVMKVRGHRVGLVVDEMRAIFAADEARIETVPEVLAPRIGGESRIKAIYRGAHGLVSILAPDQLFGETVMEKLNAARISDQHVGAETASNEETQQFLVFRLGDEEFGLPIAAVEEVARLPETIARVPKTPKFLEGVVNLRGEILPVIDQRKRFNMPALPTTAQRLVVVRTERHLAGLIVDSVSEVLRAGAGAIDQTPDLAGETTKLVRAVVNLEAQNRIILLLDPPELLTRAERGLLDTFAKHKADAGPASA
jgi:purine-binding chemotaxis protein CheW